MRARAAPRPPPGERHRQFQRKKRRRSYGLTTKQTGVAPGDHQVQRRQRMNDQSRLVRVGDQQDSTPSGQSAPVPDWGGQPDMPPGRHPTRTTNRTRDHHHTSALNESQGRPRRPGHRWQHWAGGDPTPVVHRRHSVDSRTLASDRQPLHRHPPVPGWNQPGGALSGMLTRSRLAGDHGAYDQPSHANHPRGGSRFIDEATTVGRPWRVFKCVAQMPQKSVRGSTLPRATR